MGEGGRCRSDCATARAVRQQGLGGCCFGEKALDPEFGFTEVRAAVDRLLGPRGTPEEVSQMMLPAHSPCGLGECKPARSLDLELRCPRSSGWMPPSIVRFTAFAAGGVRQTRDRSMPDASVCASDQGWRSATADSLPKNVLSNRVAAGAVISQACVSRIQLNLPAQPPEIYVEVAPRTLTRKR